MLAAIPIATPDVSYVTPINSQLNISNADFGVLANDFDADSASITAEQFGNPVNGSVTLNSNGTFTFNPTAGFEGIGSFRYRVFDGANYSRVKPVSITVGSGVAQVQNGQDRTQDSFLHDGALTLSQPLGAGVSLEYRSDKNEYDAIGRVRKVFDPSGRFTESVYDVKHRIIKSISVDPDGSGPLQAPSTEYMVNDVGNVESMTDALNNVTIYGYDDLDRLTSVTLPDPDGSGSQAAPIYSMDYDAVGNIISQTDALGRVTTIEYDNLYRQETVTQPAPRCKRQSKLTGMDIPIQRPNAARYRDFPRDCHHGWLSEYVCFAWLRRCRPVDFVHQPRRKYDKLWLRRLGSAYFNHES